MPTFVVVVATVVATVGMSSPTMVLLVSVLVRPIVATVVFRAGVATLPGSVPRLLVCVLLLLSSSLVIAWSR